MKKLIFVFASLLCFIVVSSFTVKPNDSTVTNDSTVSVATPQDYCPKGYVCEATNVYAAPEDNKKDHIYGISVYKNSSGEVIAYVPKHGHLRCYWKNGINRQTDGWCFDANSTTYRIIGYTRK